MTRASRFHGTVGRPLADSQPWFDEAPDPGAGAANVVVVPLDDTGYAQFGCHGSGIETPNIDSPAAEGLQFNNFHVTPVCSPTGRRCAPADPNMPSYPAEAAAEMSRQ